MSERHIAAPATDQTIQHHPDLKPEPEKKSWLDLSPVQVMGGALAAMTAAGLGSRFSVEGTVVGAALASVIAAVASALYTASLRRTSVAVRGVIGGRRTRAAATRGPSAPQPAPTGSTAVTPQALSTPNEPAKMSRRRALVLSSVLGALTIFVLAGGVLTIYEAIAGQALSGGRGTTVSQVQQERSENRRTDEPAPAPADSAEPSESADPTPTAESSDTPEPEAAPMDEPSAEPSVEPSAEPSVEASVEPSAAEAEPSATAEQPSTAPSQPAQTPR